MKKYEFTNETVEFFGANLYRIRALIDIPKAGVKAGDLGGFLQSEKNLSVYGNAWVSGNAQVSGNAWVYDNAQVSGDAWVSGNAQVSGYAWVYGNAWVSGNAQVSGDAWVYGNAWVSGNARVYGNAQVSGNAQVNGDAQVSGNAQVNGDAWDVSPLYIQGSKWSVCVPQKGFLKVGCQCYSMEEWRTVWKDVARAHNAQDLAQEYVLYYNLAAQRYGYPLLDISDNQRAAAACSCGAGCGHKL